MEIVKKQLFGINSVQNSECTQQSVTSLTAVCVCVEKWEWDSAIQQLNGTIVRAGQYPNSPSASYARTHTALHQTDQQMIISCCLFFLAILRNTGLCTGLYLLLLLWVFREKEQNTPLDTFKSKRKPHPGREIKF